MFDTAGHGLSVVFIKVVQHGTNCHLRKGPLGVAPSFLQIKSASIKRDPTNSSITMGLIVVVPCIFLVLVWIL